MDANTPSNTETIVETTSAEQGLFAEAQTPEQASKTEPPKTEEPKVQDALKDPKFASKFAALGRKEKEVRARERALAAREQEIQKRLQEMEERSKSALSEKEKLEQEFKENPLKAAQKYGYTFEQLAEMQLNDENPTPDMKIKRAMDELSAKYEEQIKKLEKRLEDKEKQEKEKEQLGAKKQVEAQQAAFKSEIKAELEKQTEKYEISNLRKEEAIQLAYEVIEELFLSTCERDEEGNILYDENGNFIKPGRILSVQEALDHVEAHFEEEAKPYTKLKKFQQTSAKPKSNPETETEPTLSNTLASEVPQSNRKFLSDEESKREAAKLIKWAE